MSPRWRRHLDNAISKTELKTKTETEKQKTVPKTETVYCDRPYKTPGPCRGCGGGAQRGAVQYSRSSQF